MGHTSPSRLKARMVASPLIDTLAGQAGGFGFAAASRRRQPPNYALKRTVREEVSGAIMRCGPHGRLASALGSQMSAHHAAAIFASIIALAASHALAAAHPSPREIRIIASIKMLPASALDASQPQMHL